MRFYIMCFILLKRWNGLWEVAQSLNLFAPVSFLPRHRLPPPFSVCFVSWPILSNSSHFYRILVMKCVQYCLGKTCHSDFSLFLEWVWFHLAAASPFFHKRIWLLSVIKMHFLYMVNCFSQLWLWQACAFLSISVMPKVVKA